jgi:hypothetical protein
MMFVGTKTQYPPHCYMWHILAGRKWKWKFIKRLYVEFLKRKYKGMRIGKLKKGKKWCWKGAGRVEANLRRGYARRSLSGLV